MSPRVPPLQHSIQRSLVRYVKMVADLTLMYEGYLISVDTFLRRLPITLESLFKLVQRGIELV